MSARKTFQVPSVTMKGGSRNRVTMTPLTTPHAAPAARPDRRASAGGQPESTPSRPITTDDSTMIAPTDRSIPAVRMISVWATPRKPMIVTC